MRKFIIFVNFTNYQIKFVYWSKRYLSFSSFILINWALISYILNFHKRTYKFN